MAWIMMIVIFSRAIAKNNVFQPEFWKNLVQIWPLSKQDRSNNIEIVDRDSLQTLTKLQQPGVVMWEFFKSRFLRLQNQQKHHQNIWMGCSQPCPHYGNPRAWSLSLRGIQVWSWASSKLDYRLHQPKRIHGGKNPEKCSKIEKQPPKQLPVYNIIISTNALSSEKST